MSNIGISTACFYPLYLEKALKRIAEFSAPCCEIFFNCFSELENPFLKELKNIADAGGVKVSSIHPFLSALETFLFFTPYERRFYDGLDQYKRFFEAAQFMGAQYFVFHGAFDSSPFCGMDVYCERYQSLCEQAKPFGITVTHENVCRTVTATPEFVKDFKNALNGEVSFTFDLKQCVKAGQDPIKMLDAMGNNIKNFHINDFDFAKKECRLPLEGDCDISGVVNKIKSLGYNGNYIIEVYSDNYMCDEDIRKAASKLKAIV